MLLLKVQEGNIHNPYSNLSSAAAVFSVLHEGHGWKRSGEVLVASRWMQYEEVIRDAKEYLSAGP